MSTSTLRDLWPPVVACPAEDTDRIEVTLAALMVDLPSPYPDDVYPEPWNGIVDRVGTLPLHRRLEALGRELEKLPGVDVDATLSRVFGIDPRRFPARKPSPIQFPISPSIIDRKPEIGTPPFETRSLAAILAAEQVGIEWCVEGLIPSEGVAILGGPPGQGKSWMLLELALAFIAGRPWLRRFPTRKGRVLYIDEESPPALLQYRLHKLARAGADGMPQDDLHFVIGQGLCLAREASLEQLRSTIAAIRPTLVIVDSLIRVHGSEENSASEMAKVFAGVKGLVREFGCSVIFADHQKKPGLGTVSQDLLLRGTTEKVAFVDTLLSLTRKDGTLIVEHSKSRFALPVPAFVVTIEDQGPDRTVVRVAGDAEEMQQQVREEKARDLIDRLLADGSWQSRPDLTEAARKSGVLVKTVDELLRTLNRQGVLEREDRKPESGRGNKTAFYRKNPVANSVSDFQSIIGEEIGNWNATGSADPDEALSLGLGREAE